MKKKKTLSVVICITILAGLLRFYKLSFTPPGLYWDEVSIGYNAYSILKTGRDEYGKPFPLLFRAFGEYKLPVYIYATAAAMKFFGKTDFAVRFPSALAGTLTVLATYFLTKELFLVNSKNKKQKTKNSNQTLNIAALAALLLAISPWHLQFSRAGFEANLGLLFLVVGSVAFLRAQRGERFNFIISVVFFVLAFATYNSARLFAPLLLISSFWIYQDSLEKNKPELAVAIVLGFLLILSFIPQFISGEALIRAQSTSIFNEKKPVQLFLSNYFANFDTTFLFFRGDQNGRHSVRKLGMLYVFELPLILLGLKSLLRQTGKGKKLLFSWLFLAPIPASLTKINPHALRSLNILPAWQIIAAFGALQVGNWMARQKKKKRLLLEAAVTIAVFYNVILYLHQYYVHYPRETALDWQDGLKETVEIIAQRFDQYEQIFVSGQLLPAYIGFYLPVDPLVFQSSNSKEKIGKIVYFGNLKEIEKQPHQKTLVVGHWWQKPPEGIYYQEVKMINGDTVFNIWED